MLRYRRKISGPLLDRIDIRIEVPAVAPEDLSRVSSGDSSSVIRVSVEQARAKIIARQGKENARLTTREIDMYGVPDEKGATLLKQAISKLGLSARGIIAFSRSRVLNLPQLNHVTPHAAVRSKTSRLR